LARPSRPIIVRRSADGPAQRHHGGAWKVAYADFVTAMMSFFLLLWLLSTSSEDTLKGLAEYFSDATTNSGTPAGQGGQLGITFGASPEQMTHPDPFLVDQPMQRSDQGARDGGRGGGAMTVAPPLGGATAIAGGQLSDEAFERELQRREDARFEAARAAIAAALADSADLQVLKDNLVIDETPEGLRIQIVDRDRVAMFPLGSDVMYAHTRQLLGIVAKAIAGLPNRISIRGHTDALPFPPGAAYDNWRLSSDRADATRVALVQQGLDPARVAEVVGRGDAEKLVATDPTDPTNRRISLVLLHERQVPPRQGP
jgi:chemotaxis protein MotB